MQSLIDFFVSQFGAVFTWLGQTISDVCSWVISLILSLFGAIGQFISFTIGRIFEFYRDQVLVLIGGVLAELPGYAQYSQMSDWLYLNLNMILPLSEAFGCAIALFHLWILCWLLKIILKLIPTIY